MSDKSKDPIDWTRAIVVLHGVGKGAPAHYIGPSMKKGWHWVELQNGRSLRVDACGVHRNPGGFGYVQAVRNVTDDECVKRLLRRVSLF